jgi:hypothetical protein
MSSRRVRSGGISIFTTLRRKNRSSRKSPRSTISRRFLLVAAIRRTSTLSGVFEPTRSMVRSESTRSSLIWVAASISPISSRNRVPPSACSKRPIRRWAAPVKAPFFVAEKLAFQQLRRKRRAMHRDHLRRRPAGQVVEQAGDDLLAGAGFAFDQDRGAGRRDLLDDFGNLGDSGDLPIRRSSLWDF